MIFLSAYYTTNRQSALGLMFAEFGGAGSPPPLNTPLHRVWKRHPGSQSNADDVQGVLGEGTLGYKVMLLLYRVCLVKAPLVTK